MVKYPEGRTALILMDTSREDLQKMIKESLEEVLLQTHSLLSTKESTSSDDLLSRSQAAALLGISLPTLSKYMIQGKIKYSRIGKKVLYSKNELLSNIKCN